MEFKSFDSESISLTFHLPSSVTHWPSCSVTSSVSQFLFFILILRSTSPRPQLTCVTGLLMIGIYHLAEPLSWTSALKLLVSLQLSFPP